MFTQHTKYIPLAVLVALSFVAVMVWQPLVYSQQRVLMVSFLNVGQGDAVLVTTPSGKQLLVDGGRDSTVLRELGSILQRGDRSIDMVLATHPDSDHIAGLVEVLKRFMVTTVVASGVEHESSIAEVFTNTAQQAPHYIEARRGQVYDFGDGVLLHILFPDREVASVESNTGSVVAVLTYGEHSFVLSGDSPQSIEKYLVSIDNGLLHANVLKAGHHGSKTSNATTFVGTVGAQYVVYSRGCDNSYGHPHTEVLERFVQFEAVALDTCTDGRVTFTSDGTILSHK